MSEEDSDAEGEGPQLSLFERRQLSRINRELTPASMGDASPDELLFQHTVLCQASLPYRNPGDEVREWSRKNGRAHLEIIAGKAMHPEREELVPIGLPFGPKPRLILSHLNAEALRTGSPEIEVEASLTAFIKRIGLDANGYTVRGVKDQLTRLSASIVRLGVVTETENVKRARTATMPFVESFDLWFPKDDRQRVLWPSTVNLNPTYFESLQRHAVPLHPAALGALSNSAMGLDIYAWLAQRLHRIPQDAPQFITWKAVKDQFGWHYGRMDNFRRVFSDTLKTVLRQYPAANHAIEADEKGLALRHCAPPVLYRGSPVVRGGRRLVDPRTETPGLPAPVPAIEENPAD